MKQTINLLVVLIVVLQSCNNTIKEKPIASTVKLDSINVVSLKNNYPKDQIHLLNEDGSTWKTIEVADDFSDAQLNPFAVKMENSMMVFKVVGRKNDLYAITVNEETKLIKYIKPGLAAFDYQTWPDHIVKAFAIDFDETTNPQRAEPSQQGKIIKNESEFFHPVSVQGRWLKIKSDNDKESWIKWCDAEGKLIIAIYYDA